MRRSTDSISEPWHTQTRTQARIRWHQLTRITRCVLCQYSIFGRVIDGQDSTLDAMERIPVDAKNRPKEEIRTLEVVVHANPIAAQ